MSASSRDLVRQTLECRRPARAPRQLWTLPWAESHHGEAVAGILRDFPPDIAGCPGFLRENGPGHGDPTEPGVSVDDWGCTFVNIQRGVIGEVKEPLVGDWDADRGRIHVPVEWQTVDGERVNRFCAETEAFVLAGCCPRPFEQLQFLRGTADLCMDLLTRPAGFEAFLADMHRFYCGLLELWARTDVDGLMFMDDWGSQQALLIDPSLWRELFKPMYRDYAQIARGAGKKLFMHSDGHTLDIFPDLVELGVDAVNSQVFCMGVENLAPFAGKVTFWGEIDRQHILPEASPEEVAAAVAEVHRHLWRDGGCIAQCEFGAGARPENVREVFAAWDRLTCGVGA